jgi:tetratricopeptide (TPR) repeat protein
LDIEVDIGDRNGEATSLCNLGSAHQSLGDYKTAILRHRQSLAITRRICDCRGEAMALGNLGNVYASLKDYKMAIELYQESLTIKCKIGDRSGEANSLHNLGTYYSFLGDHSKAIELLEQSLFIKRTIRERGSEAHTLYFLSTLYLKQLQFRRSRIYRFQVYRIWQELQIPLAALPFSDFQKRMFQGLGEDWIGQQIQIEQKLAWFMDSISLIIFIIRWFFSPMRWIRKRLRSKK